MIVKVVETMERRFIQKNNEKYYILDLAYLLS